MPRVMVAKPTGFCFGVERAIRLARAGLNRFQRVWTYGEIVHNPQVLAELAAAGIKPMRRWRDLRGGALVIRAHGCPPTVIDRCKKEGIAVIDATCPYVRRVQSVARRLAGEGYQVVVVGERNHPEVRSILAAAGKGARVYTPNLKLRGKVGVVAQTTISREGYKATVANLLNLRYTEVRVFDTVCAEVSARQTATEWLARKVEGVIVVGGRNSANTTRLAEIVARTGKPVVHVATAAELDLKQWRRFSRVGVVAGASTPASAVAEITRILRKFRLSGSKGDRV